MTQPASFWQQFKFVTGNPGKVKEASILLGVDIDSTSIDLEEIQTCDVEVAVKHKLHAAHEKLQCPVMVEDSGLVFSSWNGLPGALVKWFEQTVGLSGMLTMLNGFSTREAVAICFVALHDGTRIHVAKGEVKGTIAEEPRGEGGFGWDAIFIPDGHNKTFGEMSPDEKNSISHRGRAFEALKKLL